jgi:hypothetical protein
MHEMTRFSRCWKEVGEHVDLHTSPGRLCATLTHPR